MFYNHLFFNIVAALILCLARQKRQEKKMDKILAILSNSNDGSLMYKLETTTDLAYLEKRTKDPAELKYLVCFHFYEIEIV